MLVSVKDLFHQAQREKFALGAFNVYNLETVLAVAEAADELRSPVIIETTPKAIEYAGLDFLAGLIKKAALKTEAPVILHLDHGLTIELAEECIEAGYTSIMIDGSHLPLPENIALTKRAVEIGHKKKVWVEGELGGLTGEIRLTDPHEVPRFVKETNVDSLAVSLGSKHGHAKDEKLDLELLYRIREKTHLPLVLHGSTGVPDEDIRGAVMRGVCKVNVDTLLKETFTQAISESLKRKFIDPRVYLKNAKEAVKNQVKERMLLFGSVNA